MIWDIHEAMRYLGSALGQGRGDQEALLEAISKLSGREQLAALLESLLVDRQALAAAAQRSYTHPLGFDKFVLATSAALEYQLSLHVWPERQERVEDVHNHRFAFASAVLDGVLEM
jgi:hypothetical protein